MSKTHQPDAGKTPADRKPQDVKQGPRDEELDRPIGDPKPPDGDDDKGENDEPGKPGDVQNDEPDEEIGKPQHHKV